MKTVILCLLALLVSPNLLVAGDPEVVWSSEDLSIVKDRGSLLSVTATYKITLSKAAAKDLRHVLNTYVKEQYAATALKSKVRHPLGRFFIDLITCNIGFFKKELNNEDMIGEHGVIINVWVLKANVGLVCTPPDILGIQEKISDTCWAVINPWSWQMVARA